MVCDAYFEAIEAKVPLIALLGWECLRPICPCLLINLAYNDSMSAIQLGESNMPELPEVETVVRGIRTPLVGQRVQAVHVRESRLRWPVPVELSDVLSEQHLLSVTRRAKYLLLHFEAGTLMIHLGMSGVLTLLPHGVVPIKHDHIDILFDDWCLRYNDPRRFGSFHWLTGAIEQHKLLCHLGPEPLSDTFNGEYLYDKSKRYRQAVKPWLSNQQVVVGVGNIYASESLFLAKISPKTPANRIAKSRYVRLVDAVQSRLRTAIEQGGTTLKDFTGATGKPGYFAQSLLVYGRDGEPCTKCEALISKITQVGRSTFYCPHCQKR